MKTEITIEKLAELMNETVWSKGDLKRIYIDRGFNTKKMSTKTYIYEVDGEFKVSCYVDCPSQPYQWCQSQAAEVIERVMNQIEGIIENELAKKIYFMTNEEDNYIYCSHLEKKENEKYFEIKTLNGIVKCIIKAGKIFLESDIDSVDISKYSITTYHDGKYSLFNDMVFENSQGHLFYYTSKSSKGQSALFMYNGKEKDEFKLTGKSYDDLGDNMQGFTPAFSWNYTIETKEEFYKIVRKYQLGE